jgi:hypothetical protein
MALGCSALVRTQKVQLKKQEKGRSMIYVAFALAIAFYGAMYFFWAAMQSHLSGPTAFLMRLRDMVFGVPDLNALVVFKELILLTALYLLFDFALSTYKRARRPQAARPSAKKLKTVAVQQGRTTVLVLRRDESLHEAL